MNSNYGGGLYAALVRGLSILVLCVILIAGLWPFHSPRNEVGWIADANGLRFGRHGIAVSRGPFPSVPSPNGASCSLEMWLTPELVTSHGAILAFDSSPDSRSPFSLWQYGSDLAIQRYMIDGQGVPRRPWLRINRVFREGEPVLLTITSGREVTAVYVDGVMAGQSATLGLISGDLTGRLIVANSTVDEGWSGEIRELAIYDRELTPAEIATHHKSGIHEQPPVPPSGEAPTARYLFNEREGNLVHNQMDPETDLTIPIHYFVLHPAFLRPLWDQFDRAGIARAIWSYRKDIVLNVAGFIPVGFVFMAYLSSVRGLRRSSLVVIIVGFALSFMIEALQRFLPTRDSGMADLVTNTAGTIIGVALYRLSWVQALINRIQQVAIGTGENGQRREVIDIRQATGGDKVSYSA